MFLCPYSHSPDYQTVVRQNSCQRPWACSGLMMKTIMLGIVALQYRILSLRCKSHLEVVASLIAFG